jgi:hypothetical protein
MAELREGVGRWLAYLDPVIAKAREYRWSGPDQEQFWPFLKRAAITRQYEAIEATLQMFDAGSGHFAVTFLRPAYEEYIWLAYLGQHLEEAHALAPALAVRDLGLSLEAENEYSNVKQMAELGFTQRFVKAQRARGREAEAQIREIGRKLKWPSSANPLPSMSYLSRQVGREREYRFLYHATSRFVHFSAHELGRRVWGEQGKVHISSSTFSEYWSRFALYWAFWLLIHAIVECHDVLGDLPEDPNRDREMEELLRSFAAIPIITYEELETWKPISLPRPR